MPVCGVAQDEPFHVRQTRQYCEGNWDDWDPKITTFPGLYLAGVGYARLLQLVSALWRASAVSSSPDVPSSASAWSLACCLTTSGSHRSPADSRGEAV